MNDTYEQHLQSQVKCSPHQSIVFFLSLSLGTTIMIESICMRRKKKKKKKNKVLVFIVEKNRHAMIGTTIDGIE